MEGGVKERKKKQRGEVSGTLNSRYPLGYLPKKKWLCFTSPTIIPGFIFSLGARGMLNHT